MECYHAMFAHVLTPAWRASRASCPSAPSETTEVIKAPLYAQSGVTECWIVDLESSSVEVYAAPRDGRYTTMTTHRAGDELRVPHFPEVVVPVADILPPRS